MGNRRLGGWRLRLWGGLLQLTWLHVHATPQAPHPSDPLLGLGMAAYSAAYNTTLDTMNSGLRCRCHLS